ncbi:MFS transporter, FSR family, fosmidomycin resistance protein [Marinitoga hydrogenitolerans DSM 16785]|uniref:MFS transporter, FSR family, fosmidomycin resistance protein n=1 Tax=Marinitoga hydrogenitolerans (strain DSM 16785 / JCM 12826 / AT1271) TaxID=1122195 RepID=A0A1M5ALY2_MARH1|nr:MFS transporter [Marinitoga hydrogenitolerans]SHF30922.1 MFS transporter, FSR family, fosmidomycin resistance protein [Marinitoga hydrogenitolerans DSM 16785]
MEPLAIYITFTNFFTSFFKSYFKPLIPFFMEYFNVNEPRIFVMMASILTLISSFSQVFFGYLADKSNKKLVFLYISVLITMTPILFLGHIKSIWFLFIIFLIGYLGSSAQEPLGAGISGALGKGKGIAIAIFMVGGTFGYALGPVFITYYVSNYKLENLTYIGIVGILLYTILFYFAYNYFKTHKHLSSKGKKTRFFESFKGFKYIAPIWFLTVHRAFVSIMFRSYVPIKSRMLGYDLTIGGLLVTLGFLAGTFSNLLGAKLEEKTSVKFVNLLYFSAFSVLVFLFASSTNIWILAISYILADAFMFLTMSVNVHYAQQSLPNNKSFASGALMGFTRAMGNVLITVYTFFFGNNIPFILNSLWVFGIIGIILTFILIKEPIFEKSN